MNCSQYRRMPGWVIRLVLAAELAFGCSGLAAAVEMRTWSDSSGRYQIKARFLRVEGENVFLEREDGEEFKIELKRLSPADRQYIQENAPKAPSPFQTAEGFAGSSSAAVPKADGGPGPKQSGLVQFNAALAKAIPPTPRGDWKFTVAEPTRTEPSYKQVIPIPPVRDFFEHTTAFLVNGVSHRALVGYTMDHVPMEKMTRLILCNLEDGRTIERFGPGKMIPLALSDNGKQVLMHDDIFNPNRKDRLEIWTFTRSSVEQSIQWYPKGDGRSGGCDVRWAAFVNDGRLVTLNQWGMLVVWQLEPLRALYYMDLSGSCTPAISPDRQYLVCASKGQIGVIDLKFGKLLATRPIPDSRGGAIAFSPSGQRLACGDGDHVFVWDFATGELRRRLQMTSHGLAGRLLWTSEAHVLSGDRDCLLFGVDNQLKLWEYQGLDGAVFCNGVCWLLPSQKTDKPGALLGMQIPHAAIKNRLDKAAADPNFYVFRPGVTVRLRLDGLPNPAGRDKVRALLTERVKACGCQVGPNGTIDLVASAEREKPQPKQERRGDDDFPFRHMGPFSRGSKAVRSPPSPSPVYGTNCLKFVYQEETVWQATEWTPQDGVTEYAWFQSVRLPETVAKGGFLEALGSSEVTPSGIWDK